MLVTVCHGGGHLAEKPRGLRLGQAAAVSHQTVHVPMGPREKGVKVVRARQDLCWSCHMPVGRQPGVGLQHRQGLADRVYLWTEHGMSTVGTAEPRLALETVTAEP